MIPLVSVSDCDVHEPLEEFEAFAEPRLDMRVLKLLISGDLGGAGDQQIQSRLTRFASKCILTGNYPLNANKNTMVLQPLGTTYLTKRSIDGDNALQALIMAHTDQNTSPGMKQYYADILDVRIISFTT